MTLCRSKAWWWLVAAVGTLACSPGGPPIPPDDGTFLGGDRSGDLPQRLSEIGLFETWGDERTLHASARPYVPRFALWTNGSDKQRYISLPPGERIDVADGVWSFPKQTLFFKTFSYEQGGKKVLVETRVIRLVEDGVSYGTYLWDEDGRDAQLLDGRSIEEVRVEVAGDSFDHAVPNRLQCRMCHETAADPILGFDAERLDFLLDGEPEAQLEKLAQDGLFHGVPAAQGQEVPDGVLGRVLSFFEGNCVHCHNGGDGENASFDLRMGVAVDNLVGVETTSELLHGVRVAPGSPDDSALYRALVADPSGEDSQAMPPLGVQRKDEEHIELVREWIASLD